jgi:hypothetical protein
MAIALVAHVGARSTDSNGITSSAIDTTGATLIVINLATALAASGTISDSKGNTWTALTQVVDDFADRWAQLYYCESPTVGSGHTFSVSGSATFPSLGVAAFSGTAASSSFDVQNHATNGFSSSVTTGSVTPSVANELVIAAMSYDDNASTPTIGSSFTITDTTVPTGFGTTGQGLAYLVETTATAQNPTWSWTNGSRTIGIAATFKASGGAAAAPPQGWENLARDIPRPPTVSLSAAPAFVSTFRTAAVAGIAWQGPRDHVKLPPKVSLSEAPGYGRTPFTAASTIAGIAWQGPRDHVKLPPKTSNSEQPALGRFVPAVGISDKKPGQDQRGSAARICVPCTARWHLGEAQPGFAFAAPPVRISGMAWYEPADRDRPALKGFDRE